MKKSRIQLLCLSMAIFIANYISAQKAQSPSIAKKEINAFRRIINRYQNIYDRYKKCSSYKCTSQEKEALQKELRTVARDAAIVGTGIVVLTAAGITAFLVYKKKHQAQLAPEKPEKEEEIPGQEPVITAQQEEKRRKEAEEQQKQQEEEQKRLEQERRKEAELLEKEQEKQRKEVERLQKEAEEKQRKEQEELRKQQEQEQKRLEQERRKEEERLEKQRREEEKRLKEEMIRLQKEAAEKQQKDEVLTIIRNKFALVQNELETNNTPIPQILTELKNKYRNNLTLKEAESLEKEIKVKLTIPIRDFLPQWKELTDKVDNKATEIATTTSEKKQRELATKLQKFNFGYYYPIKETFLKGSSISSLPQKVTKALTEFNNTFSKKTKK